MNKNKSFDLFTDEEWIEGLTSKPVNERLHEYFFKVKCAGILRTITRATHKSENFYEILGEFYEFLSKNDWRVLRLFKGKNDATLYSYLMRCTINYFMEKHKKECDIAKRYIFAETIKHLAKIQDEVSNEYETEDNQLVMKAFLYLGKRDKHVLRLLVIDGKSSLEAADEIWPYVNSEQDWRDLAIIRVQNTIAMIKHRAILRLAYYIKLLRNLN